MSLQVLYIQSDLPGNKETVMHTSDSSGRVLKLPSSLGKLSKKKIYWFQQQFIHKLLAPSFERTMELTAWKNPVDNANAKRDR